MNNQIELKLAQKTNFYKFQQEMSNLLTKYEIAVDNLMNVFNFINNLESIICNQKIISCVDKHIATERQIISYLDKKKLPLSIDYIKKNISGVARINITCPSVEDEYRLIDYINEEYKIEIKKIIDYNKKPKNNGYKGIHLVLSVPLYGDGSERMNVKIKMRTPVMDFIDSYYII